MWCFWAGFLRELGHRAPSKVSFPAGEAAQLAASRFRYHTTTTSIGPEFSNRRRNVTKWPEKNPPACGRSTSPCRCPLGRMRKSAENPEDKTETKGKTHAAHITRRADASGPHDPPENIILMIQHTHNEPVVSHYSCYKVHFRCFFIKMICYF